MVAQCCECSKCHRIVHFKVVNFIFYKFHFNKLCIREKRKVVRVSFMEKVRSVQKSEGREGLTQRWFSPQEREEDSRQREQPEQNSQTKIPLPAFVMKWCGNVAVLGCLHTVGDPGLCVALD